MRSIAVKQPSQHRNGISLPPCCITKNLTTKQYTLKTNLHRLILKLSFRELRLEDLPRRSFWKFFKYFHLPGIFEAGQMLLAVLEQLFCRDPCHGLETHEGSNLFAQIGAGNSDHRGLGDRRMGKQNRFDLLRKNGTATSKDSFPLPADDPGVALRRDVDKIPCLEDRLRQETSCPHSRPTNSARARFTYTLVMRLRYQ